MISGVEAEHREACLRRACDFVPSWMSPPQGLWGRRYRQVSSFSSPTSPSLEPTRQTPGFGSSAQESQRFHRVLGGKTISKLLGYASVEITYNWYIHFFEGEIDDTLRQAVRRQGWKMASIPAVMAGMPASVKTDRFEFAGWGSLCQMLCSIRTSIKGLVPYRAASDRTASRGSNTA